MPPTLNGAYRGTRGRKLRMEAIRVWIQDKVSSQTQTATARAHDLAIAEVK
jgi:hypothetical protein